MFHAGSAWGARLCVLLVSFAVRLAGAQEFVEFPRFTPADLPNCQLWLDPHDKSTLEIDAQGRVLSWRDKSPNGLVFRAPSPEQAPFYDPDAFDFTPGLRFDGVDDYLYASVNNWSATPRGEFQSIVKWQKFRIENMILASSDETSDGRYWMFFVQNQLGPPRPAIRIRDQDEIWNHNGWIHTGTSLAPMVEGEKYHLAFRGLGQGGGFSHQLRVNGIDGAVGYNSNVTLLNNWLDDVSPRHNVTLGAFRTANTVQDFEAFTLGAQIVTGEVLPMPLSRQLEEFMGPSNLGYLRFVPEPSAIWLAAIGVGVAGFRLIRSSLRLYRPIDRVGAGDVVPQPIARDRDPRHADPLRRADANLWSGMGKK